jgi:uncharacterized protein
VTALALAALLALAPGLAIPALTGPVVDPAGLLSGAEARRLEPIEDFSIRVAEAWKLGARGKDDGVLVVVARDDRRARIEVGGGLEGLLTDAQSARIIRGALAPAFREQRYGDGLYDAGLQILAATGSLPPEAARRQAARPSHGARFGGLGFLALFIGFMLLRGVLFGFTPRRRRGFWGGGGPFIGGGWGGGGGSGGGGGWGGGGGGFSGGGASGSW